MKDKTPVSLDHPVEHDGQTHATLIIRCPTVGDVRGAHRAAAPSTLSCDVEAHLFAHLTEVDVGVIDRMRLGDYGKLQGAYEDFDRRPSTSGAPAS